jgi:hypothetical protein
MPQTELDLKRLRSEMVDYIHQAGLSVFYGIRTPKEDEHTYWDVGSYPDWRQFIDVAKESGAKLVVFSSADLDGDELDQAIEKLEECDLAPEDRRQYLKQFEGLRKRVGQTAWVRAAFEHAGHWLAYQLSTPWHEEFESALDDLEMYFPYDELEDEEEGEEEGNSHRGFFSRN